MRDWTPARHLPGSWPPLRTVLHGMPSVFLDICASSDVVGRRDQGFYLDSGLSPRMWTVPPSVCCGDVAGDDPVLLSGLFEISSNIFFFFNF